MLNPEHAPIPGLNGLSRYDVDTYLIYARAGSEVVEYLRGQVAELEQHMVHGDLTQQDRIRMQVYADVLERFQAQLDTERGKEGRA